MNKVLLGARGPAGQEREQAAWPRGDEALRDAAKVRETQGDLLSNCWPHKFLYLTDLFLRCR